MPELKAIVEGNATQTIAESLKVEERVLVTPHTSISIPNIATLSVVPIVRKRPAILLPIFFTIVIAIFIISQIGAPLYGYQSGTDPRTIVAALALLIVVGLIVYYFASPGVQWRLLIGTSDGGLNYFTAPERATLEKVRDLLTEKINNRDEAAVYNINFQSGDIQIVQAGATVGTLVNGSGNQVATGNGRVGTTEVVQSQGVQIGRGNISNGASYRIDYSSNLPTVELWAEHFRNSDHREIADRLTELERLMRSGTPTPQAKSRVRELTDQLSQLLSGASDAVNLFTAVARAAGVAAG
jgi:hypothetical protein